MKVYQIFKYCKNKEHTKVTKGIFLPFRFCKWTQGYYELIKYGSLHKDIMNSSNMGLFLTHKATMYKRHYICIICVITSTPHCRIMFQKTLKAKMYTFPTHVHNAHPCCHLTITTIFSKKSRWFFCQD